MNRNLREGNIIVERGSKGGEVTRRRKEGKGFWMEREGRRVLFREKRGGGTARGGKEEGRGRGEKF